MNKFSTATAAMKQVALQIALDLEKVESIQFNGTAKEWLSTIRGQVDFLSHSLTQCENVKDLASMQQVAVNSAPEPELADGDYVLVDGHAWFTVKDLFSVQISATDEGVTVDVCPAGDEMETLASCWVTDAEAIDAKIGEGDED